MANRRPPRGEGQGRRPGHGQKSAGPGSGHGRRPTGPPKGPRPNGPARRGKASAPKTSRGDSDAGIDRLQKVLAHAGIGSRRACEEVILQGRVTVDGQVVRELGSKVDPENSKIFVDGQRIYPERMVYFAVNKPKGYVSTNNDPSGRPRVVDILPEIPQRVYTVGRLDEMSTGLILLTNDGELANKLAHPKFGVEKLYRAVVAGNPDRDVLNKLTEGIWLAEGKVRARRVRVVGKKGESTVLEMVLAEGKNREVRRMLAKLGHKVMTLTRVAVGPITLKGLTPGQFRPLSNAEVDLLRKVAAGIIISPSRFAERKPTRSPVRPEGPGASGPDARPREGSGSRPGESRRKNPYYPAPREPRRQNASGGPGLNPRPRDGEGVRPAGPPSGPPRRRFEPQGPGGPRRPVSPSSSPRGRTFGVHRPDSEGPPIGGRPPRPEGLPPSQRRGAGDSAPRRPGPHSEEPTRRIVGEGGRPPRPEGLPPSQRRASNEGGPRRPGPSAGGPPSRGNVGPGPRPPRPLGPPPSQRRPAGGPTSPSRPEPTSDDGPPMRRIIGLDSGTRREPPSRRPMPKRPFPRASLGPRRPRLRREDDDAGEE